MNPTMEPGDVDTALLACCLLAICIFFNHPFQNEKPCSPNVPRNHSSCNQRLCESRQGVYLGCYKPNVFSLRNSERKKNAVLSICIAGTSKLQTIDPVDGSHFVETEHSFRGVQERQATHITQ